MSDSNGVIKTTSSVSFPLFSVLGVVFVTLKLAGIGIVATWSWFWVLAPFWIPVALFFGVIGIIFVVVILVGLGKILFEIRK